MRRELVCRHGEDGWDGGRAAAAFFSTAHHTAAGEGLLLLAACILPHTITDYILLTRGMYILRVLYVPYLCIVC